MPSEFSLLVVKIRTHFPIILWDVICIFVYRGAVLGRQVIGVKICSCPKRDKEKDEQNFGEPSTGKRKIKVKREEKTTVEEPPLKKVKQEVPTEPGSCSFMVRNEIQLAICLLCYEALNWAQFCVFQVHAINPEVASTLKAHLHQWNGIKMWEYAEPGVIPTPVIEVVDTIAVLPHPYNWFATLEKCHLHNVLKIITSLPLLNASLSLRVHTYSVICLVLAEFNC